MHQAGTSYRYRSQCAIDTTLLQHTHGVVFPQLLLTPPRQPRTRGPKSKIWVLSMHFSNAHFPGKHFRAPCNAPAFVKEERHIPYALGKGCLWITSFCSPSRGQKSGEISLTAPTIWLWALSLTVKCPEGHTISKLMSDQIPRGSNPPSSALVHWGFTPDTFGACRNGLFLPQAFREQSNPCPF